MIQFKRLTAVLIAVCWIASQAPAFSYGSDGCTNQTVTLLNLYTDVTTDRNCSGSGAKVFTNNNGVTLSTTLYKLGNGSATFNGTNQNLSYNVALFDSDYSFAADWTIDLWFNTNSSAIDQTLVSTDTFLTGINIRLNEPDTSTVKIVINGGAFTFAITPVTLNTWNHIAFTKNGTNVRMFLNGVQKDTTKTDSSSLTNTTGITIGARNDGLNITDPFSGNMQGVRIVNGRAMWTADFTPPTTPYCQGCEMMGDD